MPIRPELLHHYRTPSWHAARARICRRAGNRCERCGAKNGALGYRSKTGEFMLLGDVFPPPDQRDAHMILIQCGCAHLNGVAGDDRDENLAWLCRGCHLRQDKQQHHETRAARKDRARPLLAEARA